MASMQEGIIAELMHVSVHIERAHETLAGVTVGELGGPLYEFVKLVATTLQETGKVLQTMGCPDLGTFVMQCLQEAEKVGQANGTLPDADIALELLVRAIPAFRDVALIDGQPVYLFKKALFLLNAIQLRFGSLSRLPRVPTVATEKLPVYSDNVLPSMLVHLGVLDLSGSRAKFPGLVDAFPVLADENLLQLADSPKSRETKDGPPSGGPLLTHDEATVLRAAAIDACEQIVVVAHSLAHDTSEEDKTWISRITLPEVDAWLWSVAKDREDYRNLPRFSLRNTVFF